MGRRKRRPAAVTVLLWILRIALVPAAAVVLVFTVLTLTEYKPAETEALEVYPAKSAQTDILSRGDTLKIMTWNIGYGALGDNADFFMDGGKGVQTASRERLQENLDGILETIKQEDPDVLFLQEIDRSSDRSYRVDEVEKAAEALPEMDYVFANNFKVLYVPYPVPPIGKVDSGIAAFSKAKIREAERLQLPCPFSWPVRLGNLKRCLEICRIDTDDPDGRQLVLVNLHLEAFDSGEGKIAQTKMLAEVLQAEADKGNYVIAGGDFNQIFSDADGSAWPAQEGKWTPGELDTAQFEAGWQFMMDSSAPSGRSLDQPYEGADRDSFQYYLIDGFIVSDNVEVKSCRTEQKDFVNSDHNPVLLEVSLR